MKSSIVNNDKKPISLTIQDTDIIIKTLSSAQILGSEAKAVSIVLDKIMALHEKLILKSETV